MDIFLIILAFLLGATALVGAILPVIPGLPLAYGGLLILYFTGNDISITELIVWAIVILIVSLIDYFASPLITKKSGGSRSAVIGSAVGVVVGLFLGPLGIVFGAFIGAFVGEIIHKPNDKANALRVGFYSFIGFIIGTAIKILITVWILIVMVRSLFL